MYNCVGIIEFSFVNLAADNGPKLMNVYKQTNMFKLPFIPADGIELANFHKLQFTQEHQDFFKNQEYVAMSDVTFDCKSKTFYFVVLETFDYSSKEDINKLNFYDVDPNLVWTDVEKECDVDMNDYIDNIIKQKRDQ